MLRDFRFFIMGVFLCMTVVTTSGCIPVIVGAGVAVGAGGYAWIQGELVNELNVSAERLHKAASRAMRDLKLAVMEDKGDRLSAKIKAKYSDGTDVTITVTARTEKASTLKVRVGLLGDKEKSEMISTAVQKRL